MILRTLHLSGFGVFCEQELADLSPSLNVIEGPNEAGKSTAVEFIRSLLFGFQRGQGKRTYDPLSGGDHGGWALVQDRHGRDLRWELKARKIPAAGLRLITELGGESGIDPAVFLGGADRELYSNVFAFSLEDMADLKALERDEVHARIYAAASGGGGVSLFTASDMIERKMADLFRPKAPTSVVHGLLRERKQLADALERLGDGVEAYNLAKQRHNVVQAQLAVAREEEAAAREASSRAEAAAAAWEPWLDLREVNGELESLAGVEAFPPDGVSRLEKSLQALQSHQERLAEAEHAVALLTRRLNECRLDPPLLDARETLQGLTERQSEYLGALRDRPGVTQDRDRAAREGTEALGRLGPGWTEERVQTFDRSIRREEEIRAHRDALLRADADVRAQEERLTTVDEHLASRRKQLNEAKSRLDAAYPEPPPELPDYSGRVSALDAAESLLRRSVEQQVELRPLQDRLKDLEHRIQEAEAEAKTVRQPLSPWLGFLPLACFQVLGILLKDNAPLAITMALMGLTCLIGWYLFAKAHARTLSATRKRLLTKAEELEQQHEALQRRYSQLQSELESAAEQSCALLLPFELSCDTAEAIRLAQRELATGIQARERYENERLTLESLEREVESARAEVEKARRRLKSCQKERAAAGELWKAWLWQRGLPAEVSPEMALRLFDEAKQALKLFRDRDHQAERVASMTAAIDRFQTEVRDLCRRLNRPEPVPEEVLPTLRALTQEAATQSKLFLQRQELSNQREEALVTLVRLKESAQSLEKAHQSLLALGGTESEEAFREKAQNWARKQALQTRCQELDRRLDGIWGPGVKRAALEEALAETDPQTLALRCAETRSAVAEVEERRNGLQAELGALNHQLSVLEKSDQITAKQRELAAKDAEIAEASEQWAVLRLTSWLLERTRKKFETERQPAVIKNAGAMMSRLTGGRYSAVVAPEGLTDIALETPQGERKTLEAWSRGTREQLYLALRFAFVQDYSSHSEPLPIIMDDVLVHADGYQRRRLAAETVAEVAQGCQVLYFTCHPDHAELLASACPGAHRYRVEDARFSRIA